MKTLQQVLEIIIMLNSEKTKQLVSLEGYSEYECKAIKEHVTNPNITFYRPNVPFGAKKMAKIRLQHRMRLASIKSQKSKFPK